MVRMDGEVYKLYYSNIRDVVFHFIFVHNLRSNDLSNKLDH